MPTNFPGRLQKGIRHTARQSTSLESTSVLNPLPLVCEALPFISNQTGPGHDDLSIRVLTAMRLHLTSHELDLPFGQPGSPRPVLVTLPWPEPAGHPVAFTAIGTHPDGGPWKGPGFVQARWHRAQERAGIAPPRGKGEKRRAARDQGLHVLRHAAASAWLGADADIVAVAVAVAAWPGTPLRLCIGPTRT